jgi:hypothetical protein
MTEHSAGPKGEHGRHPSTLGAKRPMPDRIDPTVKEMETPGPDTHVDCPTPDSGAE